MTAEKPYTAAEFTQFDRLTRNTSSQNQLTRIKARLDLTAFIKEHGKEKCDIMWVAIQAKDAKKRA